MSIWGTFWFFHSSLLVCSHAGSAVPYSTVLFYWVWLTVLTTYRVEYETLCCGVLTHRIPNGNTLVEQTKGARWNPFLVRMYSELHLLLNSIKAGTVFIDLRTFCAWNFWKVFTDCNSLVLFFFFFSHLLFHRILSSWMIIIDSFNAVLGKENIESLNSECWTNWEEKGIFLAKYCNPLWPVFSMGISTGHVYLLMSTNYSFCGWPQGSNLSQSLKGLPEALGQLCRATVRETQRDIEEKIWSQYKVAPVLVCSRVGLEGGSCAWLL